MTVLITGGAGFIGSTVATACRDAGLQTVVLDDLSTGVRAFTTEGAFYEGDVADGALIDRIVAEHPGIDIVIHCAAKIIVPQSVEQPVDYYENNVGKGIDLLRHLRRNGIERVVFSSSASIYRASEDFAVDEQSAIEPLSPYAATKAMFEAILRDAALAGDVHALSLRYFNPIGADPRLRTGLQLAEPSHALGRLIRLNEEGKPFTITGVDWPTRDGTGIRDYIHVWDLARAHVAAVQRFDAVAASEGPAAVINLGTGEGVTVRELVAAFERVVGEPIATIDLPPRSGDSAGVYTRSERARELLGWRAELDLEQGIRDALAWRERLLAGAIV
ncbi:UDP-glucose 4-epimerase GalE [Microcella alkalica]|uniref:UDP-glucose 4-epimerase n=1 Tax=Microcella alkalica TaxID=355930 RepID=A0A839E6H8_9MICO|nr:UDP-glucose 4-epimerase [Microcella alkalica]